MHDYTMMAKSLKILANGQKLVIRRNEKRPGQKKVLNYSSDTQRYLMHFDRN